MSLHTILFKSYVNHKNTIYYQEYGPHDTVFATPATLQQWEGRYDEHGDAYTQPATLTSLKSSLDSVHTAGDNRVDEYHQQDFQELISNLSGYKYFLFKGNLLYEL